MRQSLRRQHITDDNGRRLFFPTSISTVSFFESWSPEFCFSPLRSSFAHIPIGWTTAPLFVPAPVHPSHSLCRRCDWGVRIPRLPEGLQPIRSRFRREKTLSMRLLGPGCQALKTTSGDSRRPKVIQFFFASRQWVPMTDDLQRPAATPGHPERAPINKLMVTRKYCLNLPFTTFVIDSRFLTESQPM